MPFTSCLLCNFIVVHQNAIVNTKNGKDVINVAVNKCPLIAVAITINGNINKMVPNLPKRIVSSKLVFHSPSSIMTCPANIKAVASVQNEKNGNSLKLKVIAE